MIRRETTLGELCAEGGGGIQTGPFGSQLHASDYVESGVPSVMPQDIGDNVIDPSGIARISEVDATRLERYRLRPGDIVYSRRGDVEKRALIRAEHNGWLCGTGCLRVRLGNDPVAVPAFLAYYLGRSETRAWIVRHAVGATMPNLNTSILGKIPLSVPDISEQQAIAEVLGTLDDKIAANSELVRVSDDLCAALTRQALGTETTSLSEMAVITMGSSPPGTSYNQSEDGVVFYQGVRDFGVRVPTNRMWTTSPVRTGHASDTLLSVRAPVGRTNLASELTCIGRGLAAIRSTVGHPMTLFHLLRDAPDVWAPFEAEGTVFGSINKGQLDAIEVPMVLPERAARLEESLTALENRLMSALVENDKLAATRDALLPLLMSGKVRVKHAEGIVGGAT